MKCPSCGGQDLAVQDSRHAEEEVRRRRVCTVCTHRFITVEKIVDVYIPAKPGPRDDTPKPRKPPKPARGKQLLKNRATARRRLEEMADEASIYDELRDVRDIWQR